MKNTLNYTIRPSSLGKVLLAGGERGLRALFLGTSESTLMTDLKKRFPECDVQRNDSAMESLISVVIPVLDSRLRGNDGGGSPHNQSTTTVIPAKAGIQSSPISSKDVSIPLDLIGTEFQLKVWKALQRIPRGSTWTYTQIAKKIGSPTAVRAVANACGANPVAVIVPCHRVIRADGSLSGYRWGVTIKEKLLQRESERVR